MPNSPSIAQCIMQEETLRFASFDFEDGWGLGTCLRRIGVENKAPIAIEVYAYGQQIFLSALPGSCPENIEWVKRKRNTVLRNWKATLHVGAVNQLAGQRMEQQKFIDQVDYCDHGGGFPIRLMNNSVIGAVTVSGLPERDDHDLVVHALEIFFSS